MRDNYTAEDIKYIRKHYQEDGYVSVANHLGRTTAAIRAKAHQLGITKQYKKRCDKQRQERSDLGTYRTKPDYFSNGDETKLAEVISRKAEEDKDKVMLKVAHNTWVQVPRDKATPEYAAQIREKWANGRC